MSARTILWRPHRENFTSIMVLVSKRVWIDLSQYFADFKYCQIHNACVIVSHYVPSRCLLVYSRYRTILTYWKSQQSWFRSTHASVATLFVGVQRSSSWTVNIFSTHNTPLFISFADPTRLSQCKTFLFFLNRTWVLAVFIFAFFSIVVVAALVDGPTCVFFFFLVLVLVV